MTLTTGVSAKTNKSVQNTEHGIQYRIRAYPVQRINYILERLRNAKFISLDLRNGYWEIAMSPDSREHTAFNVPERGLF